MASVDGERDRAEALGDMLDHLECRQPLSMARDLGQSGYPLLQGINGREISSEESLLVSFAAPFG